MDFRDSASQAVWRKEVRTFLKNELPNEIRQGDPFEGDLGNSPAVERWRSALAARGWIAAAWPTEYGGAGLSVLEQFILNEEFAEAEAPQMGGLGVMMLGPTLISHGNPDQKTEHLPRILKGEVQWCQGYSEPGSGSDLASLQTRAIADGDDFIINGQKIWTSGAHRSDWMFMLARTDPDAPKHRGITYFLIDMKTPGITVRPLVNMANMHSFNEVFFEDVRVPRRNVLGEVNRGWYVGTTTLDFERSSIGTAVSQRRSAEKAIAWLRQQSGSLTDGERYTLRKEWTERWIEVQVGTLLSHRVISMQAAGQIPNSEASVAKLYNSELTQRISRSMLKTAGTWGMVISDRGPLGAAPAVSYLSSVSATIAGGTSEIQRNVVSTRGLGLPRA
ncbi:MAG: acyl-CoA dehydrogenase family protein [Dehalococcoidia bacterium]|nr:acyl-CoA dehydrogenase family protein [Dehalococcoidia bacterium]